MLLAVTLSGTSILPTTTAGSMPYAQQHYPFENKERFESGFPADFVAEGLDQVGGCAVIGKRPLPARSCEGLPTPTADHSSTYLSPLPPFLHPPTRSHHTALLLLLPSVVARRPAAGSTR